MTRPKKRNRIGALIAVALGALALLALPAAASAKAKDRNHDHIPDRWEKRHKLSLKVNQARRDQDHDHLRNRAEFKAGTNPRDADSDNDGIKDGQENAGKIVFFDAETGKLKINLFNGDSISGLVTEETEIECGCGHHPSSEGEEGTTSARASSSNDSEGENESESDGEGEGQSGDDGPSHDVGDDGDLHQHKERHGSCTTEDLVEGTAVKEAELKLRNGAATFAKVELGR